LLATACLLGSCRTEPARQSELAQIWRLRGTLVGVESTNVRPGPGRVAQRLRLTSSTGLVATGRLLAPAAPGCYPAVLLQDGREENSDVIGRLPADYGDVVVLSLDYPPEIPYAIRPREVVTHSGTLRRAGWEIPQLFSLGAAYLGRRRDTDMARLALVATSFAVPFATIAAAADTAFRNVALIYGAGDLPSVVAANLDFDPAMLRRPAAWLISRPFTDLEPERFIALIAPRPILMVNGIDDPQMPSAAVRALFDAAAEPKSLVWLHTGHLMPGDSSLIQSLVDTAFARLPVLQQPPASGHCRP